MIGITVTVLNYGDGALNYLIGRRGDVHRLVSAHFVHRNSRRPHFVGRTMTCPG